MNHGPEKLPWLLAAALPAQCAHAWFRFAMLAFSIACPALPTVEFNNYLRDLLRELSVGSRLLSAVHGLETAEPA